MRNRIRAALTIWMIVAVCAAGCVGPQNSMWQEEFSISARTLVPTGRKQYFILEPGSQLVL